MRDEKMGTRNTWMGAVIGLLAILIGLAAPAAGRAAAASAINGITLDSFDCATPALTYTVTGLFDADDGGGQDQFQVRVFDGLGTVLFDTTKSTATDLVAKAVSLADSGGAAVPATNPIRIAVYEYAGAVGALLNAAEFNVTCLVGQAEPFVDARRAEEEAQGINRVYDNYLDTGMILYYPGGSGDLEIYLLAYGMGQFIGRYPDAFLNGQQALLTSLYEWRWNNHLWQLYHLGSGDYLVNHYIAGRLVDEVSFTALNAPNALPADQLGIGMDLMLDTGNLPILTAPGQGGGGLPVLMPPPGPPDQPPLPLNQGLPVMAQFSVNMRAAPNELARRLLIVGQGSGLTLLGRDRRGFWALAYYPVTRQTGWVFVGALSANLAQIRALPPVQ
jgi:hypothetical protein